MDKVIISEDRFTDSDTRQNATDNDLRASYLEYRGANPNQFGRICIWGFIAGKVHCIVCS